MTQAIPNRRKQRSKVIPLLPLLFALSITLGSVLYVFRCNVNPPGFFVDESSIAYNAYTISQTGTDEFGNSWPLFFRAFGDYKNPVYVYFLALIFKLFGPSILAARLLSALAGVLTAVILGLIARRYARDTALNPNEASVVGLMVMTISFLTPWLFEISRVVLEVAFYPLLVGLFLFCVYRASKQARWSWPVVISLSLTLALLTYTYSIGRLLAPLLAFGLILFATRERWAGIIRSWAIYLLALVPLIAYQREHEGALTGRFNMVSYMKPGNSWLVDLWVFVKHYLANIDPRRIFVLGDPNIYQVTHLYGKPALLIATLILLVISVPRVLRNLRNDAWWRFVVYGAAASVVPASLTVDYFHQLRLVALPVFLLVLMFPALTWLFKIERRLLRNVSLVILILLTLGQGLAFQFSYQNSESSPWRRRLFDADYVDKIFNLALRDGSKPFYVSDPLNTPYVQAYWHGALNHFAPTDLVRLRPEDVPPRGSFVIANDLRCAEKNEISRYGPYVLYIAGERPQPRSPLQESAFHADIAVLEPIRVGVGERIEMQVKVRNDSNQLWRGCTGGAATFQIYLACHWLDSSGKWVKEEGRAPLPVDLAPGQTTTLTFQLDAPANRGDYSIELDLLQEGVTWFGLKGSPTKKVQIVVE